MNNLKTMSKFGVFYISYHLQHLEFCVAITFLNAFCILFDLFFFLHEALEIVGKFHHFQQ